MTTKKLIIQFQGWCLIRLPTDPDPADETRGVSGYSFAFGDEPDLDRILYLQPPTNFKPRSYGHDIGVSVYGAFCQEGLDVRAMDWMKEAKINLLNNPKFENGNWVLTLPGQEPIEPFDIEIAKGDLIIRRKAPLDIHNPQKSIWEVDQSLILKHGARGMEYEPETIGKATGIWDSLAIAMDRREKLKNDLAIKKTTPGLLNSPEIAILQGRINQLNIAKANPMDRRIMARYFVERFGFPVDGEAMIEDKKKQLSGILSTKKAWQINFWIGAWDPDLLSAFLQGSLEIPYQ